MKVITKIWHIARIEGKNPKQEIYKFLRQYRATPHTSTGRSPSSVLFNYGYRTRLPDIKKPALDQDIRQKDEESKRKQKIYKDNKRTVQKHQMQLGDTVLLLQKQTKSQPRYDPEPYTIINIQGTQTTAKREDKVRTRDAQKFKKVELQNPKDYNSQREPLDQHKADEEFSHDIPTSITPSILPEPNREQHAAQNTVTMQPTDEQAVYPTQSQRQYSYPNQHLDPNIDIRLERG